MIKFQLHSFECGYLVFLTLFIEDVHVVSSWHQCKRLYTCGFISELSILFFWPISLFYASATLLWLLWLCNIVWNGEVWCLQHYSFSKFLWLFGIFCEFICILDFFSISLKNANVILIGLYWICRSFSVIWAWTWNWFHLFVSSISLIYVL